MKSSVLESTWLRYLSVAVSTLIALVLSAVFWSVVQDAPFIFFFAAVAFSAWYGGLWPGMLATLASLILADYFLIAPLHAFSTRPTEVVLFLVFTLVSLLISWTENHRRQSEAAYRTVRDELQVILNGVVDGVLAQDKDGHVIFANPAASQILGFDSSQDLVNKPVDGIHSQYEMLNEQNEVIPYTNLPRQRVFAEGKPARGVILLRYLKSGEERWLDLRSAPVFDQKGNV
ncbi:MAG: DUF4118 domain-containing protein, partial [Anaerolineae bacterium]|nr:DUF4118 domain-containing protein [Anaerolineae bacterium]